MSFSTFISEKKIASALVLSAVFLAGATLVFLYGPDLFKSQSIPQQSEIFLTKIAEIEQLQRNSLHKEALGQIDQALVEFEHEKNTLLFLRAKSMMFFDTNELREAVAIFKNIATDVAEPPQRRSSALLLLATVRHYNVDVGIGNYRELLFNEEPFLAYLTKANDDVLLATELVLRESILLFPNPDAYYEIGNIYTADLAGQVWSRTNEFQKSNVRKIIESFAEGDKLLPREQFVSENTHVMRGVQRSVAFATANFFFPNEVTADQVSEAYQSLLQLTRENILFERRYATTLLMYASYLQNQKPDIARSEIETLLAEYVDRASRNTSVQEDLRVILSNKSFVSRMIPSLMVVSPNFARLVAENQNVVPATMFE